MVEYSIIKLYVILAYMYSLFVLACATIVFALFTFLNLLVYSLLKGNKNRFQAYGIGNHHKKYHAVYVISKLICLLQFSASICRIGA